MTALAPLSVMLVGLLGMLIVLGAVARIVVLERRAAGTRATVTQLAPPATPYVDHGIAA